MPTSGPSATDFDPVVIVIIVAAAVVIVSIGSAIFRRRREAADTARRRGWLQRERKRSQAALQEIQKLADSVIATSSSALIAGFEIERQIEAVFTDGHPSPPEAVNALKAIAANLGGNALINLQSHRLSAGACVASGDAVVVRSISGERVKPGDAEGADAPAD